MSSKIGKIDLDIFNSFIFNRLGKRDSSVLVPPMTGMDAGVIDIGNGKALLVAEDPIFSIPGQSPEMLGWYTVHIGASDVAVMGVQPQWMTYTLLMPPETEEETFKEIVNSIHETACKLNISIVGGHTGHYPGFSAPTIGGITVFSICSKDKFITPAGAKPGDKVILTKGPAVETAGILSVLREEELLEKYPKSLVDEAKSYCKKMTVVEDAMVAIKTGGITSMHDATEGGVIGGLFEVANASEVGMEIEENSFIFPEPIEAVCEAFQIDPLSAIAEGSLLITVQPGFSDTVIRELNKVNIKSSVIGRVIKDKSKRIITRRDGSKISLKIPGQDPFWPVFFEGVKNV